MLARFLRLELPNSNSDNRVPIARWPRKSPIAGATLLRRATSLREHKYMETEYAPQTLVALYATLADAENTLHELEAAGIPYPATRLAAHTPADLERADIAERTALAGISLPEHFWSLAVALDAQASDKAAELLRRHAPLAMATLPAPDPTVTVFCQGWYGDAGAGRYMSETHAPFWIYGGGKVRVRFAPSALHPRVTVHGGGKTAGHLVTVDVPHLVNVPGQRRRVGVRLVDVRSGG